jgi:NADH:ubiquinone oxidoreductase subunit 3 (subunit A)
MFYFFIYYYFYNFFLVIDPLYLYNNFNNTFLFLILSTLIGIIMLSLSFFLNRQNIRNFDKISEYECGSEPFDSAIRQPFTVHFYIVGILFLIFDVEIALLMP